MLDKPFIPEVLRQNQNGNNLMEIDGIPPECTKSIDGTTFHFYRNPEDSELAVLAIRELSNGTLYTYIPSSIDKKQHKGLRLALLSDISNGTIIGEHLGSGHNGIAYLKMIEMTDGGQKFEYVVKVSKKDVLTDSINNGTHLIKRGQKLFDFFVEVVFSDISKCPLKVCKSILKARMAGVDYPEQFGFSVLLENDGTGVLVYEVMELVQGVSVSDFIRFLKNKDYEFPESIKANILGLYSNLKSFYPNRTDASIARKVLRDCIAYNIKVFSEVPNFSDLGLKNTILVGVKHSDRGSILLDFRPIDPVVVEYTEVVDTILSRLSLRESI